MREEIRKAFDNISHKLTKSSWEGCEATVTSLSPPYALEVVRQELLKLEESAESYFGSKRLQQPLNSTVPRTLAQGPEL